MRTDTGCGLDALAKDTEQQNVNARDLNKLGAAYAETGDLRRALRAFERARSLGPDFAEKHYNLGCVYMRLGRWKDAIAALQAAAHLNPQNAETFVMLGSALGQDKQYGEAVKNMERAAAQSPDDAVIMLYLGNLYLAVNNKAAAIGKYKNMLIVDPTLARKLYMEIYRDKVVDASARD